MIKVKQSNAVSAYNVLKQIKTKELPAEVAIAIWKNVKVLKPIATSYEDAYRLYQDSKPAYEDTAKKWNQKLLYSVTWPASGFYSNKKMESIEDFKGAKTRTYDKNSADFVNDAGGNAVALPWGEVYSALRTGMVDSVITSSSSGLA